MKPLQVFWRVHCENREAVQILLARGDVKEARHGEEPGPRPLAALHELMGVRDAVPGADGHRDRLGLAEVHQVGLPRRLVFLVPLEEPLCGHYAAPPGGDGSLEAAALHALLDPAVDRVEEEVAGVAGVPRGDQAPAHGGHDDTFVHPLLLLDPLITGGQAAVEQNRVVRPWRNVVGGLIFALAVEVDPLWTPVLAGGVLVLAGMLQAALVQGTCHSAAHDDVLPGLGETAAQR